MKNGLMVVGLFVVMAMAFSTGAWAAELTVDEHTVALWHFNEGSGNIVYDESGNGNHGTIHGATWTTGVFGSALSFDGSNDYVSIPNLGLTSSFSLSVWVKTDTFPNAYGHIVGKTGVYRPRLGISKSTGVLFFDWHGHGTENRFWSKGSIPKGEWTHVVYTYDAGTKNESFYIDSKYDTSQIHTGGYTPNWNFPFRIGWDGSNVYRYKGLIDEVAIYNRTLSAEEIAELASRNKRPIADAGDDQVIFFNEGVTLDGTNSSDPEEEPLTYTWYEDLNKNEILEDEEIIATGPTPTLTYTETDIGIYYYQLIVNDGELDSKPDTVTIGVAGEGRPKPNMAFNISQMKIHWVGNNRGTIHFEIPELPEGITSQDDLLPQGTIITIEIPTKADPNEYAVGQDEIDFNIYRKLWNTLPQHIRPEKQR